MMHLSVGLYACVNMRADAWAFTTITRVFIYPAKCVYNGLLKVSLFIVIPPRAEEKIHSTLIKSQHFRALSSRIKYPTFPLNSQIPLTNQLANHITQSDKAHLVPRTPK